MAMRYRQAKPKLKRVALVSDPLVEFGGEQRVLATLAEIFPHAPIYTGLLDLTSLPASFRKYRFITPPLWVMRIFRRFPARSFRLLLLFYYSFLDLSSYELIVSSGTLFAKFAGIFGGLPKRNLAYIHTPPRFLYGYETASGMRRSRFLRLCLLPLDSFLRLADFFSAGKVDFLLCNSQEISRRIRRFYGRQATVINPPVSFASRRRASLRCPSTPGLQRPFLIVSRLEKYKNVDLAIEACKLIDRELIVVGKGRMLEKLKKISDKRISFRGFVDDSELERLYQQAKAFIFPIKDEDFGITPLEAQYFGCPVVAHRSGGALETVLENRTGVFFDQLTPEALADAMLRIEGLRIKPSDCVKNASKFSKEIFKRRFLSFCSHL